MAASFHPGCALALLLGLLLAGLPRLLLPGRLLLLLLLLGLARLLAGLLLLLLVHLVLWVVLLLHGKYSFRGERQAAMACQTVRGELSGSTFAHIENHFVSMWLTEGALGSDRGTEGEKRLASGF